MRKIIQIFIKIGKLISQAIVSLVLATVYLIIPCSLDSTGKSQIVIILSMTKIVIECFEDYLLFVR